MKIKFENKKGVSMISLVITIVVIIILASIAISNSSGMIDESMEAVTEADILADNEEIKALLTYAVVDDTARIGIALSDATLVILGSGDVNYGTGYYLVVGGDEADMKAIGEITGGAKLNPYKKLTAPYVVNYDLGTYERIEEVRVK